MRPIRFLAATLRALHHDQRGGTAVEYGLIVTLIVIAMVSALSAFAETAIGIWNYVAGVVVESDPTL